MRRFTIRPVCMAPWLRCAGGGTDKATATDTEAIRVAFSRLEGEMEALEKKIDTRIGVLETEVAASAKEVKEEYSRWFKSNERILWASGTIGFVSLILYGKFMVDVRQDQARLEAIASMAHERADATAEIVSGAMSGDVYSPKR